MSQSEVDDLVRYTIAGNNGELRFTSFEILPPLAGTKYGDFLRKYFSGRCLKEVRREDISFQDGIDGENKDCLAGIFETVGNLKKLFY